MRVNLTIPIFWLAILQNKNTEDWEEKFIQLKTEEMVHKINNHKYNYLNYIRRKLILRSPFYKTKVHIVKNQKKQYKTLTTTNTTT